MNQNTEIRIDFLDFLDLVDDAWYSETKGEIQFDAKLEATVMGMWAVVREMADATAAEQYGVSLDDVLETVSEAEAARRVAAALNILMYGGVAAMRER